MKNSKSGCMFIIGASPLLTKAINQLFKSYFSEIIMVDNSEFLKKYLTQYYPRIIIIDINNRGIINTKDSLTDIITEIKDYEPHVKIIVLGTFFERDLVPNNYENSNLKFIEKPWNNENLINLVKENLISLERI